MAIQDTEISRIRAATLKNTNKLQNFNENGSEININLLSSSYISSSYMSSSVLNCQFLTASNLYIKNNTSLNNLTASDVKIDYLNIDYTIKSDLIPKTSLTYNLGIYDITDTISYWNNLYVKNIKLAPGGVIKSSLIPEDNITNDLGSYSTVEIPSPIEGVPPITVELYNYWNNLYVKNIKLYNGGGIDFSRDGSATGVNSAILDDYEEGSWNVELYGTWTNNGSITSKYVKIGRQVTIMIFVNNSGGNLDFTEYAATNLPFVATQNPAYAGFCCGIRALGTVWPPSPPSFPGQSEILPVQVNTYNDRLYILKDSSISYEQGVAIYCTYYTSA